MKSIDVVEYQPKDLTIIGPESKKETSEESSSVFISGLVSSQTTEQLTTLKNSSQMDTEERADHL